MHRYRYKLVIVGLLIMFVFLNYWLLGSNDRHSESNYENEMIQDRKMNPPDPQLKSPKNEKYESTTPMMIAHFGSKRNTSYPVFKDINNGIVIYGKLIGGMNYSVFSSTMHNEASLNYLFDLPLAALAWKRIGYRSIVILVMDSMKRVNNQKASFVISTLFDMDVVVIMLETHHNFAVMVSQVARLFVPYIIAPDSVENLDLLEETYIVTSDADLWPLQKDSYFLPPGMDILSLNSYCCGEFQHQGKTYFMIPMGSIGMKYKMWKTVTRRHGFVPLNVEGMIRYFSREFGTVATDAIQKGENLGWFLDQRMVSILVQDWANKGNNTHQVRYVGRNVGLDRIDRNHWRPFTIKGKVDTHIIESAYQPHMWGRLEALLVLMYDRPLFTWCHTYARQFLMLN